MLGSREIISIYQAYFDATSPNLILVAKCFLTSESLALSFSALQNLNIQLAAATEFQGFQGVKQCFATSIKSA
jgi:hypothetical protein